ncbi:MAG: hypothetical protein D6725_16975 [Planctomycetota bacterium]|nr:MAG: hypothetical protein D6725_16975 [Planctomycetota bacterium]
MRLKQIVADGRVAVAHPRLEARTDRLRIDLVEPPTGPSPANAAVSSGRSADGWTLPAEERPQENASPVLYVDAGTIVLGIRPLPDGRWQLQNVVTEDAVRVTYGPREPSPPLEATAATYGPSLGENAALGTSSSAVSGLTDPSGSIVRHAAWPAGTGGQPNVATDAARDTPLSFEVLGERLSIDNASDPRAQLLSVSGSPAQLRTPEARLSGPLILFDRRRAEAHVHGAGVLQILADEVDLSGVLAATPSAAGETPGHNPSDKPSRTPLRRTGPNRAATDATLAGRRPATDAPDDAAADTTDSDRWLTIRWQEEMRFDGRQADFFGDVRATLQTFHMRCQEMAVTLDQPLQVFQTDAEPLRTVAAPPPSPVARHGAQDHSHQTGSAADRPQIERVVCREAVAFDAYQYHNGALAGVRKVHCGRFEFHRGSGAFRVRGPGRILNWSREDDQPHPVLGSVRAQANQPLQAEQAEWQFVRIDFAGEAHGNVQERFTTFLDRVRVVYGPVDDPRTELDPERLPPSGIELTADALDAFLPQARHGDDTLQLLARGNVKLAGRSFFARAETVSYDDAKGLFVLTARGDQPAAIWRQKVFGGEYSRAEARRMEFNPSRNELRMFGIVGAQGQP